MIITFRHGTDKGSTYSTVLISQSSPTPRWFPERNVFPTVEAAIEGMSQRCVDYGISALCFRTVDLNHGLSYLVGARVTYPFFVQEAGVEFATMQEALTWTQENGWGEFEETQEQMETLIQQVYDQFGEHIYRRQT